MKIDLHGMIEKDAIGVVLTALLSFEQNYDEELEIITGNGQVLKDVVIELLNDEGWKWTYQNNNYGLIIVLK